MKISSVKEIIKKTAISDSLTGREYNYVNYKGNRILRPYVTEQSWSADGTKFIFGYNETLFEYDTVNQTARALDNARVDGVHLMATVTPDDKIYYRKAGSGTWCIDWKNYCKAKISDYEFNLISVTNDGRYITGTCIGEKNENTLVRFDTVKNIVEKRIFKLSSANNSVGINHVQINPEYSNLMFFCNEGNTAMPDRMWLADWKTESITNVFVQARNSDGTAKEYFGHEVWGSSGEKMYWVSFSDNGTEPGLRGLCRSDKNGLNREYINRDYPFWHCYPSGDDKWIVADTAAGQIILVNTKTKRSNYLAKFVMTDWNHPNQPHPVISPNSKSVGWQMKYNGILGCAWIDVSDITK